MISKTLDKIQKDLDFIKAIANEEYFKKVEEQCEFVNTRNKELQDRIDKAIEYIESDTFKCKNQVEQEEYNNKLLNILKGDNK